MVMVPLESRAPKQESSFPPQLAFPPPTHNIISPPSKKRVDPPFTLDPRAILFLERLSATQIAGENNAYRILPGTHKRVLDILESEDKELWSFVQELRYELYDDERIIFKTVPTRLHSMVCALLSKEIDAGYKSVLEETDPKPKKDTRAFINSIVPFLDSQVRVEIKKGTISILSPDNHWGLVNAEPAGLILEITCTQSFDNVKQKAEKYFIGSKFQVRMVIAIQVDAESGIEISMWKGTKARGNKGQYWTIQAVKEQEQIEKKGRLAEDGYLAIPLNCFGPLWKAQELLRGRDAFREVRIPYTAIVGLVKDTRISYGNFQSLVNGPPNDDVLFRKLGEGVTVDENSLFGESEDEEEDVKIDSAGN